MQTPDVKTGDTTKQNTTQCNRNWRSEKRLDTRHGDIEFGVGSAGALSALVQYISLYLGLQLGHCMNLRRDLEC